LSWKTRQQSTSRCLPFRSGSASSCRAFTARGGRPPLSQSEIRFARTRAGSAHGSEPHTSTLGRAARVPSLLPITPIAIASDERPLCCSAAQRGWWGR
jgi:hypothetical protein